MSTDIHMYTTYMGKMEGETLSDVMTPMGIYTYICRQFFGTILVARTSSQKLQFFFVLQLCFVVDYPKVSS